MGTKSPRQQRKDQTRIKAALAALFAVGGAVVVGVLYFQAVEENPSLDPDTFCRQDGVVTEYWAVLIDTTGTSGQESAFTEAQKISVKGHFEKLTAELPPYSRLTIHELNTAANSGLEPVKELCKPPDKPNPLYTAVGPTIARFEEEFQRPLSVLLDQIVGASGAPRSPIMETIRDMRVRAFPPGRIPERKVLVVISDLMEYTDEINFYDAIPRFVTFQDEYAALSNRLSADFRDFEFRFWMLRNHDLNRGREYMDDLAVFWNAYVKDQGADRVNTTKVDG